MLGGKMNDLLIKVLSTVMVINAGMHFYYAYKKNVYESLKFLILTVLMAVSVGTTLTKQEIDNVWEKMTIIEQKIEMQEEEKKPEELNKRSGTKWDSKIVRALNAITEEKEKSESNAEESVQSLLHGN
ncbi:MAG: hypothetical protein KH243_02300 [Lachnospiraceae bacterium]|jgi:hypothetical protein|nr:hypothetical protein [Lachnospiraceae bacterium]